MPFRSRSQRRVRPRFSRGSLFIPSTSSARFPGTRPPGARGIAVPTRRVKKFAPHPGPPIPVDPSGCRSSVHCGPAGKGLLWAEPRSGERFPVPFRDACFDRREGFPISGPQTKLGRKDPGSCGKPKPSRSANVISFFPTSRISPANERLAAMPSGKIPELEERIEPQEEPARRRVARGDVVTRWLFCLARNNFSRPSVSISLDDLNGGQLPIHGEEKLLSGKQGSARTVSRGNPFPKTFVFHRENSAGWKRGTCRIARGPAAVAKSPLTLYHRSAVSIGGSGS